MNRVAKPKMILGVYEVRHLAGIKALETPGNHSYSNQREVRLRTVKVTDQSRLGGTYPINHPDIITDAHHVEEDRKNYGRLGFPDLTLQ